MPQKRNESDEEMETTSSTSKKRGRFGDKKTKSVNHQTLENARRVLELANRIDQNPIIQALKNDKANTAAETPPTEESESKMPPSKRVMAKPPPPPPTKSSSSSARVPLPSQEEARAVSKHGQFFDPNLQMKPDRSRRRQFAFVQEGQFEQEAELERLRMKYGDDVADRVDKGQVRGLRGVKWEDIQRYLDAGQKKFDPASIKQELKGIRREDVEIYRSEDDVEEEEEEEEIPNVEWWDQNILEEDVSEEYTTAPFPVRSSRITFYIEHPVPIDPPGRDATISPQPLRPTRLEMRKMRMQRRQQRERAKQELIKQGLLEPPKPKVKLSNMMRVLAEDAVSDPTSMEREIRNQMIERQQAHEDRNLARKLTPAERKAKNIRKLFSRDNGDVHVCVFKVAKLTDTKIQFKVTVNAEENRLTGCCLVAQPFSLVVVEGCSKATRRYRRLMLRRIKWTPALEDDQPEGESMEIDNSDTEAEAARPKKEPYGCYMVWEGFVKERAFEDFKMDECRSEAMARRYLGSFMVGHYWDLAKAYNPDEISTVVKPVHT